MKYLHTFFLTFAAALVLYLGMATAQTNQRVPVDQATTQQKAKFVENLVTRSVAAKTIETQGDQAAKDKLAEARALVERAKADIVAGKYDAANGELDDALHMVNAESRRLAGSDLKMQREQEAYDKHHKSVRIFLSAYKRVANEKALSAAAAKQVSEIEAMLAEAEGLAQSGNLSEANELLTQAYLAARGDVRGLREGDRLTRSLNFETAEDEYLYEKDRNDSHVVLLQLAIDEKKPTQARQAQIEQLRLKAAGLREQAEEQAAKGDHATAIDSLVRSTDVLLQAIRVSGVWIPG